jgi:hypothetical protein
MSLIFIALKRIIKKNGEKLNLQKDLMNSKLNSSNQMIRINIMLV